MNRFLSNHLCGAGLGNYTGFTCYYNPFTGEAQLNTTIPRFLQPFIACHEVAHQLGYAKENEASFVGYLAAKGSGNALLQYSTYLDIFMHANRNLFTQIQLQQNCIEMHYLRLLLQTLKSGLLLIETTGVLQNPLFPGYMINTSVATGSREDF
jgi:hypothetical protein